MDELRSRRSADYARLESYLALLAYANRLRLLSLLQQPLTLDEIILEPSEPQAGERPDRHISRQAVQNHLDKLMGAGLVRARETKRKGRRGQREYVVDNARVFAVFEELRKVTEIESRVPLDPFATMEVQEAAAPRWDEGPKLVLAHGLRVGHAFQLSHKDLDPPRGWIVGRAPNAHVQLTYDPFVSQENAEVLHASDGYRLLDLRTSTNGTFLNWQRLPVGGEMPLHTGDVIGVGRSLLVFREK